MNRRNIKNVLTSLLCQKLQELTTSTQVKGTVIKVGLFLKQDGSNSTWMPQKEDTRKWPSTLFAGTQGGRIINMEGKIIGDTPVLLTKTLASRNTLMQAITDKYSKVTIESNLLTATRATNGDSVPPGGT